MPYFWDEANIFFKSTVLLCVFICVARVSHSFLEYKAFWADHYLCANIFWFTSTSEAIKGLIFFSNHLPIQIYSGTKQFFLIKSKNISQ